MGNRMKKGKKNLFVYFILFILILLNFTTFFVEGNYSRNIIINKGDNSCCQGYTLISYQANINRAILINMEGKVIRRWFHIFPFPAKILPNGNIIFANEETEPSTHATEDSTELIQLDWNENIVWSFKNWDDGRARQHHDFQREGNPVGYYAPGQPFMENGNTLILSHKNITNSNISDFTLIDDVIYEVDWEGNLTGFKWLASDHFDELGFDEETKKSIKEYPGCKCEIFIMLRGDYLHINSISYLGQNHWYDEDPEKYWYFNPDNIILDSRHANFIIIISKVNGSIVWRVGPRFPENYKEGYLDSIIGPHNAHMIPKGLPGEGNILVFDNGGEAGYDKNGCPSKFRNYSRVIEFDPVTNEIIWEYKNSFGDQMNWFIKILFFLIPGGKMHHFFSAYVSNAQRLPNGNTLITEGMTGRIFEVTPDSVIVWDYNLPLWIPLLNYRYRLAYRAYRIPPEWVPKNPSGYENWDTKYISK